MISDGPWVHLQSRNIFSIFIYCTALTILSWPANTKGISQPNRKSKAQTSPAREIGQ